MAKFLEHVIIALAWLAVIGAGAWFGAPIIYQHFLSAEQAVQTVKAEQNARSAETTAANSAQASCAAEITGAIKAAQAIRRASAVQPVEVGKPRPMIGADQIQAILQ